MCGSVPHGPILLGPSQTAPCLSPPVRTFTCVSDCLGLPRARVRSHFLLQSSQRLLTFQSQGLGPRGTTSFHSLLSRAFPSCLCSSQSHHNLPFVIFTCLFPSTCRAITLHSSPGAAHGKICTASPGQPGHTYPYACSQWMWDF